MEYKCYYCNYGLDEDVAGPDYITLNKNAASKIVRVILAANNDFFGLINHEGRTIQFVVEEDGYITVDMPIEKPGSEIPVFHQRKTGLSEVEKIIANLPDSFEGLENALELNDVIT